MPSAKKWTDVFTIVSRSETPRGGAKTTKADVFRWGGVYLGRKVEVTSTVRLVLGNMAHFMVNSGARISCHPGPGTPGYGGKTGDWNLRGGHYVDLCVKSSEPPLTDEELV